MLLHIYVHVAVAAAPAAPPAAATLSQQQQFRLEPSLYHDPAPFAMIAVQLVQKAILLGLAAVTIISAPAGQGLTC